MSNYKLKIQYTIILLKNADPDYENQIYFRNNSTYWEKEGSKGAEREPNDYNVGRAENIDYIHLTSSTLFGWIPES